MTSATPERLLERAMELLKRRPNLEHTYGALEWHRECDALLAEMPEFDPAKAAVKVMDEYFRLKPDVSSPAAIHSEYTQAYAAWAVLRASPPPATDEQRETINRLTDEELGKIVRKARDDEREQVEREIADAIDDADWWRATWTNYNGPTHQAVALAIRSGAYRTRRSGEEG